MSENGSGENEQLHLNEQRRRILKLAGASIAMSGVAGCSGDGGDTPTSGGSDGGDGGGGDGGDGGDTPTSTDSGGDGTATGTSVPTEQKMGGTLNVAMASTWETLFPMKHAVSPSYYQIFNVAPRFAYYDFDAGEVVPGALSGWEWADEEQTALRCTLKEGMTFHKGYGEATAEDAVWTINSIVNEGYGGGWIQKFLWPTPPIQGAEQVDEYTFDITMEQTYVPIIIGNLTNTSLISKDAVEDMGAEQFAQTPVSAGPYEVVSSEFGATARLERFEDGLTAQELGYAGPAYADAIEFEVVPEPTTRLNLLQNGEIDMIPGASAQNQREVSNLSEISSVSRPAWNFDWLYVGGTGASQPARDALNQVEVRQAIGYAVDRQSIVDNAYFGYAEPDDDMLTDEFAQDLYDTADEEYSDYDVFPLEADPEQARSLLQEAGYENLEIEMTTRNRQTEVRAAQVVVQNLSEAGFDATINQVDATTFSNIEREGNYDVLYSSLSTLSPDYEQVINYYLPDGDLNSMGYDNPEVTELIRESRVTTDETERDAIFRELFRLMIEDAPWVYLCHTIDATLFGTGDGLDRDLFAPLAGYLDLTDVYVDE